MTFADKVKTARAKLMISQEEFAKLLGVSRITVR
ncbi:MAG: helix-turn-helix domain-containing protein [Clostridia bacterium]|nr:helix-turn-helix domain-containing protein [Clostridia bacterium]